MNRIDREKERNRTRRSSLLLLPLLVSGMLPPRAWCGGAPPPPAESTPVFLDSLLKAKDTRRSGYAPYVSISVPLGKATFPHALLTVVRGVNANQKMSVLTFNVGGRFERFQATVGRQALMKGQGIAPAYFEVWGDGTCLFRSVPIYPPGVSAPGGRNTAQDIDLLIRGTRTLQLVTRFGGKDDETRADSPASNADGCVWGDARLLTSVVTSAPATVLESKTPTPDDSRRDAVRLSVLLLAASLTSSQDGTDPPALPLRVALLPLRPSPTPAKSGRRRRGKQAPEPADVRLQDQLQTQLRGARHGADAIFTLLSDKDRDQIAQALPDKVGAAVTEPSADDLAPVTALCGKMNVDALVLATMLPPDSADTTNSPRLELRLLNAHTGALLSQRTQPLPPAPALLPLTHG